MRKYILLIISLLILPINAVTGNTVSSSKAEQAARNFLSGNSAVPSLKLVYGDATTKSAESSFYVFATGDTGFIIISGNDGMEPVLGYSFESNFNPSDIPEGLKALMEGWKRNITAIRTSKSPANAHWEQLLSPTKSSVTASEVKNLHTALWGQEAPYYNNCPTFNDSISLTGCCATALSIIMKHHKWPDSGYGTIPAYTTESLKLQISEKTLGHQYNWDKMLTTYSGASTAEQNQAVATIMEDIGKLLKSDYCPSSRNGTNAYLSDVIPAMITNMKYSPDAVCRKRCNFPTQEWVSMLKKDIDAGLPVFYRGASLTQGGHYFVIDGYDSDSRLHFNWGWSGSSNGFFFIPDTEFSNDESAIFGLAPNKSWTEPVTSATLTFYSNESSDAFPFWAEEAYIPEDTPFKVHLSLINSGNSNYSGDIKLCLRHSDKTLEDASSSGNIILNSLCWEKYYFNLSLSTIAEGDELVLYYQHNGQWTPVDDGALTIPLRYKLPKVISLEYINTKGGKKLKIHGMAGMTLNGATGKEETFDRPVMTIEDPYGTCDYVFSNGHENYTVRLIFPPSEH